MEKNWGKTIGVKKIRLENVGKKMSNKFGVNKFRVNKFRGKFGYTIG